jgi:HPt (histidine-containing phosphotransfer) domain-containing protein
MIEPVLFNRDEMLEAMDGDVDFMCSILDESLDSLPNEIEILRTHIANNDAKEAHMQAHTIKGVAANIFAPALCDICLRIESAAKGGDIDSSRKMLPELERICSLTITEIKSS